MKEIGYYERSIIRKIAKTFELAGEAKYPPITFTIFWLLSDVNKRLISENGNDLAQSAWYQLDSFILEMQKRNISLEQNGDYFPKELNWTGYLLTYWQIAEEISGKELIENYNIEWIFERYDTLHTTSIEDAIDRIKENCPKGFDFSKEQ